MVQNSNGMRSKEKKRGRSSALADHEVSDSVSALCGSAAVKGLTNVTGDAR